MRYRLFLALGALGALGTALGGCGSSTPAGIHPDGAMDGASEGKADGGAGSGGDAAGDGAGQTFAVGGVVTGLSGTGLILSDGAGHQLAIAANGAFTFPIRVTSGANVSVTAAQQPMTPSQACVVAGGTITGIAHDVTTVTVTCATSGFTIGGTLTGVTGSGLILQDNGGDDLALAANGAFTFAVPVKSGATFTVSVKTQPSTPAQVCQVSGGSGTVGGGNVTSVVVTCGTSTYSIGGTTAGLVGTGLVLEDNGGNDLSITSNGVFAFAAPLQSGESFAVTVKSQPSSPIQSCSVSQGSGTVATANVSTIVVACSTTAYTVSGTVAGLAGTGLVLQDNHGDNLPVTASGAFSFPTPVASGAAYLVSVLTQPSSPNQTCTVATASGVIADAAVGGVTVTCATNTYVIGGTALGVVGSGLVLKNEGGDDLPISASGAFSFATSAMSGTAFAVTIASQPSNPPQTCTLSGATGTVGSANITSVTVNCLTNQYTVGGTVSNLAGTGLSLSLNGGAAVAVSSAGAFAFPTTLGGGTAYTVTVVGQPTSPWQTCAAANATGTIAAADVTSVAVDCTTNSHVVGGTVSGLTGLGLTLQDNGGDDLAIAADGAFVFPTSVTSGQGYGVTVSAQPGSPSQTCVVGSGTGGVAGADITNVSVTCSTNVYSVGGTLTGLAGTVVLHNGAGDSLSLTANGSFAFATTVASGGTYAVTVTTQPTSPYQTCAVTNGGGTVTSAAIANVAVTCATNTYTVGGTVAGLGGSGLILQDNGGDDLAVGPGSAFTFATPVPSGTSYAITIKNQPSGPTQTCSLGGPTGTIGGANVSSVTVNCTTNTYLVGGTVTGLVGSGLVIQNNGAGDVPLAGSGTFAFAMPVSSGAGYAVTVKTQPTDPWQTCTTTGGAGTVASSNVSVPIVCAANKYDVSVAVTNLAGSGLVLQDNAGDNLPVGASGTFTFATQIRSGLTYAVTVLSQPTGPWQTCSVTAPSGSIAGGPVTLAVGCTTNSYTVGGAVSGLTGTGLVVRDNGGDDRSIAANGTFTFATSVASGGAYAVTVATAPSSPAQSCVVTSGSGSVTNNSVTGVTVTCANVATCGTADEGQTLSLSCPPGRKILSIDFASYGTPAGMCGAFTTSSCSSATSVSVVSTQCAGQNACTVGANNTTFGDPCVGTFKHLWVQASCS